jgi:predicted CXXCH cytochrome family protein
MGSARKRIRAKPLLLAVLYLLMLGAAITHNQVLAKVSGPCSSCHTMHYSQGGTALGTWGGSGPYQALLANDCVGCHTGTNNGTGTPHVFSTSEPVYNATGTEANTTTLAGGNFWWVAQGGADAKGHNVDGIVAVDGTLTAPPGFNGGRAAADGSTPGGGTWPGGQQVTCAGVYGCHGSHTSSSSPAAVRGGHHHGVSGAITVPGSTPEGGYRMLVGIAGYEDSDREYRPTENAHNQYKGVDGAGGTDNSTISYLCAQCHGAFHDDTGNIGDASPWLRHPTDFDMGNTGVNSEYRDYGGVSNTYQVVTPVGSSDVSSVKSTVAFNDDSIVTCISCHRAHGTPYYKMVRWDYAGSAGGGFCANCHTSKD